MDKKDPPEETQKEIIAEPEKEVESENENRPGRPTVLTEDKKNALIALIAVGLPITAACACVGIHRDTYYAEKGRNPQFSDDVDEAKYIVAKKAITNITGAVARGSLQWSAWWAERTVPELQPKQQIGIHDESEIKRQLAEAKNTLTDIAKDLIIDADFSPKRETGDPEPGAVDHLRDDSVQATPAESGDLPDAVR